MMKRPAALLLALSFALYQPQAGAKGSFLPSEIGGFTPIAATDGAPATLINPGALAFADETQFFASRSYMGINQTNLFLSSAGSGYGWQQYAWQGRSLNRYSVSMGTYLGYGLAVGGRADYVQFLDALGGDTPDIGVGIAYRPSDWLALGLAAHHLTQPTVGASAVQRDYRAGLAIRPGTDRLLVTLDAGWREGDPLAAIEPWLGVQAEPFSGILVRGQISSGLQATLGLGLRFDRMESGLLSGLGLGGIGGSDLFYMRTSSFSERRSLRLGKPQTAYLRLTDDLSDRQSGLLDLRSSVFPGVLHLTQRIEQARQDAGIDALLLDIDGIRAEMATLQELREAIAQFKASGKRVVAYIHDADVADYYLASAADEIIQHPSGMVSITGIAANFTFFRGALDKLGIQPQFVQIGQYKAAAENLTRKEFTQPAYDEWRALYEQRYQSLLAAIATARKLSPTRVTELIDKGIYPAPQAKEQGLVDRIAYPDEVAGYGKDRYPLRTFRPATWRKPDLLAVLSIEGTIVKGEGGEDLLNGTSAGSSAIARLLREIREDEAIKAVVIRIDSPGGSAVGSDEIGREIDRLKEEKKSVVISMGNVAASGGYWISAKSGDIYANPDTLTGSIGVVTGGLAFGGLMDKVGVTSQTIKFGEHADMGSGFRPLSDNELKLLEDQGRFIYQRFVDRVSQGRKLAPDEVEAIAQGRIWSGNDGVKNGLVDKLGGLMPAIEAARQQADLDPTKTMLDFYPKRGAPWERISDDQLSVRLERSLKVMSDLSRPNNYLLINPPLQ